MFSSRTLTDRNNDQCPWNVPGSAFHYGRPELANADVRSLLVFNPDPAYQYGTLPENPILTECRTFLGVPALWVEWIENGFLLEPSGEPDPTLSATTPEQRAHAHRVLSLLAAVTR